MEPSSVRDNELVPRLHALLERPVEVLEFGLGLRDGLAGERDQDAAESAAATAVAAARGRALHDAVRVVSYRLRIGWVDA